jgi:hypothetical protein
MTKTLISRWRPLFYGCGGLALVAAAAGAALAHPQPALTIPECAQASLVRSTIDPKKPDAKQKSQQAAHLQQACEAKMKQLAAHPAPTPQTAAPAHPAPAPHAAAPSHPAPPPKAQPQQPTAPNHHSGSLFGGFLKFQSTSSSGPAPHPDRSQAPSAYSGPAPSYGPAPSGYGAAPAQTAYGAAAAPAAPAPSAPAAPAAPTGAGAAAPMFGRATTPAAGSSATNPAPLTPEQLNVFGVELYQTLKLPACATGSVDTSDARAYDDTTKKAPPTASATCVQADAAAQPIAQRFADLDGVAVPQKLKFSLVRLASERCPSWVGGTCTLGVATQGGVVIGVSFFTRPGQERAVEQTITSKYGSAPSARDAATCNEASGQTGKHDGMNRTWSLNDLTVRYRPLSGLTCDQGRVLVDGTPLKKLRDQRVAASSSEPKM